ncbi:MAG: geranylgeranylglycerol-phosphate geranylgeranyltransferase [Candidatus Marinimicrobia bacterium]|nr:geranylgeranylglycerol-phosphate geranylgeranyltransferase [Candidatus Neomarinimicrobiota bacterium]
MMYLKIVRPLNVVFAVLSLAITADILNLFSLNLTMVASAIVIASFTAGGNVLNDIIDLPIDRINRPGRPLVSGKIPVKVAAIYASTLFLLGAGFSFYLNYPARLLALAVILPLLLLYTPIFKKIPLLGNVLIAAILAIVFIFSEVALTGIADKMWFPAGLAFGLSLIRELVKDMEDIRGDTEVGVQTFPVRFGMAKSFYLLLLVTICLCLYALIPYFQLRFGYVYFGLLIVGVEIPLLLSLFWLSKKMTPLRCSTVSLILKFSTLMGMIVIWSTALY